MTSLVLIPIIGAAFEVIWRRSAALRPHRTQLRTLLAIFWLCALFVYFGTVWNLIPQRFHYGSGVLRVASDALTYQAQAAAIVADVDRGSLAGFADWQKFTYSKLLAALYLLFGRTPLAGMLFNAIFYMASLIALLLMGRRLAGERVATIAVWIAGLWPSFLLHEVHTIRWVITTAGLHVMLLGCVLLLARSAYLPALLAAVSGYLLLLFDLPYIARIAFMASLAFSVVLCAIRITRPDARAAAVRLASFGLVAGSAFYFFWVAGRPPVEEPLPREPIVIDSSTPWWIQRLRFLVVPLEFLDRRITTILIARDGFIREMAYLTEGEGLAVGTTLHARPLRNSVEFVTNLPSAYAAAFFAPTPAMLLSTQPGASNARRYVLTEMIVYYALLLVVPVGAVTVWRHARTDRFALTFLALFIAGVMALLGTVVVNAGTLHRFRQPYVSLLLVLSVAGLTRIAKAAQPPGVQVTSVPAAAP